MSAAQSRSRSPIAATTSGRSGRCSTTVHAGEWLARSSAASTSGLYSTTRAPSMPHEAVTTTTGSASSIRAASSAGANPPKTTECTAPSRAQASIAMTASGIIGR